jgi:hypothetical protein
VGQGNRLSRIWCDSAIHPHEEFMLDAQEEGQQYQAYSHCAADLASQRDSQTFCQELAETKTDASAISPPAKSHTYIQHTPAVMLFPTGFFDAHTTPIYSSLTASKEGVADRTSPYSDGLQQARTIRLQHLL